MAAPQQPRFVPFVTDLGLKSDLNMHRAHSGPLRVRIEARQWWRQSLFGRLIIEWSNDQNGLRQQGISTPFPVSQRGKPGRGRFPPRRKHAARQQRALSRIDAAGSPHKRAAAPLCIPCEHTFCIPKSVRKGEHREMKIWMAATSSLTFMTFS